MAKQFDVFLCHNSQDKPLVKQIARKLMKRGIVPWLDEWELPPGRPWQPLLERQIRQISSAAVFVGSEGIGPWQQQEVEAFLRELVNRNCPVIPVILPNAPHRPQLPLFLRGMTWVDFRKQDPDPMQQLYWGITGQLYVDENGGDDDSMTARWLFTLQNTWWSIVPIIITWAIIGFVAQGSAAKPPGEQMMFLLLIGAIGGSLSGAFVGLAWLGTDIFNRFEQIFLYSSFGAIFGIIGGIILSKLTNYSPNAVVGTIFGVIISGVILWRLNQKRIRV